MWIIRTFRDNSPRAAEVYQLKVPTIRRKASQYVSHRIPKNSHRLRNFEVDRLWCIIDATKLCVITARIVPKVATIYLKEMTNSYRLRFQMVLIAPSLNSDGTLRLSFPDDSGCGSFSVSLRPSEDILRTWTL